MIKIKDLLKPVIGLVMLFTLPSNVYAHGYSEFPSARQNICFEQGGIWSGNPPNQACALAKLISGVYPFVQRNEFAHNIKDYNNMNAVKAAIPNGTLCYANDPQKKGIGVTHTAWTRTTIKKGVLKYIFRATAPHNPSFWQFFLTKRDVDLSEPLKWEDLELIHTAEDVQPEEGKYYINVPIPSDRSGDAILFVRWQRRDPAGEGFYNCSDITITDDGTTSPDSVSKANLHRGSLFIPNGFNPPKEGDVVKYDIINKHGSVARTFDIHIDSANINDWARLLASKINGWHEQFKNGAVFIGDWHEEMQHYMYFQNDPSRNYFNAKDSQASGLMMVIRDNNASTERLAGDIYELKQSDKVVKAGEKVVISTKEPANLTQTQGTTVKIENNDSSSFIIDTSTVKQDETLIFSAHALNNNRSTTFTFEVIAADDEAKLPDPDTNKKTVNAWDSSKIYHGGDKVSYADKQWKAHWWIKGGDNPESAYKKNEWGVWRPAS